MSSVALRSSTRVCSSIFARFASSSRFFSSAPSAETPSPQTAVVSKRQTRLGKNLRPSNIGDAEWDSQADYDIVRLTESNKHMPTVKELVAMVKPAEFGLKQLPVRFSMREYHLATKKIVHPGQNKASLYIKAADLQLSPAAFHRFRAIVGLRYNENNDELRIVSNQYDRLRDNLAHTVELLKMVVVEARRADDLQALEAEDATRQQQLAETTRVLEAGAGAAKAMKA